MKKILLIFLVTFFAGVNGIYAQQKYGHINSDEIRDAMPEYKALVASLEKARSDRENRLKNMYASYQKKAVELSEYQNTLMQAVFEEKKFELDSLQVAIQEFEQTVEMELEQMRMKRLKPLNDKYLKIVDLVAKENGYTYIFDIATGSVVYYPENNGDITDLVKKKMGIQ